MFHVVVLRRGDVLLSTVSILYNDNVQLCQDCEEHTLELSELEAEVVMTTIIIHDVMCFALSLICCASLASMGGAADAAFHIAFVAASITLYCVLKALPTAI